MLRGVTTPRALRRAGATTLAVAVLVTIGSPAVGASREPGAAPKVSPEARALARDAAMTTRARTLYLANRPTVDSRADFTGHCPAPETPDSYVLGCYRPGTKRIHVLRIERPELASGMVVTAGHELLHAAHDRMTKAQRRALRPLLEQTYVATADPKLHEVVDSYPERERVGEMYARLGTEVAELPSKLERHYAAYFRDRAVVLAASAAYRRVFADLDTELGLIAAEMQALKLEEDALRSQIDVVGGEAERLSAEIGSLRAQGRISESNRLVEPANAAARNANSLVATYNGLIERHHALFERYNALALSERQLVDSLRPLPLAAA